ncbi:MAG TPA: hypothetical protein VIK96_05715 [Bacilli bacterium]
MDFELLIVSNYDPKDIFAGINHLWLKPPKRIESGKKVAPDIRFDYLIFSDLETLGDEAVLTDQGIVITNFYFQTSCEDFFCVGPLNGSSLGIEQQYKKIKEFLFDPI